MTTRTPGTSQRGNEGHPQEAYYRCRKWCQQPNSATSNNTRANTPHTQTDRGQNKCRDNRSSTSDPRDHLQNAHAYPSHTSTRYSPTFQQYHPHAGPTNYTHFKTGRTPESQIHRDSPHPQSRGSQSLAYHANTQPSNQYQ